MDGEIPYKETAWLISGLDVAVLEKNMRPASKVLNAPRKASERTTSLRGGVPSRLLSAFEDRRALSECVKDNYSSD